MVQPFKQAHREVYRLTPAEEETGNYSNRFAAHILRQHQMAALAAERGWRYHLQGGFDSGDQMLDHPSLVERLPNGLFCVNDDYRHRVVIIDPNTKQIVWQYGQTDAAGTGHNQLDIPDGFDLLAPDNTTPTHSNTG